MSRPWVRNAEPLLRGDVRPDGTRAKLEARKWKYLSEMTFDELHVALKQQGQSR
jgi:hypothetical protein